MRVMGFEQPRTRDHLSQNHDAEDEGGQHPSPPTGASRSSEVICRDYAYAIFCSWKLVKRVHPLGSFQVS